MTKKHFIALADKIRTYSEWGVGFSESEIEVLAEFCQEQNPRFNRDRWIDYVHGRCGKNGGKVKQAV